MNCRDCEPFLVEAARESRAAGARPSIVSRRSAEIAAALEHAASCVACNERLHGERSLSASLRGLAVAAETREPSAGSEAIVMAAYRTERGREKHARRWFFALSGAMAASLVMLLGTALLLSRESGTLVKSMTPGLSAKGTAALDGTQSEAGDDAAAMDEDVTDFVAFYPGADTGAVDAGALVRVRVPSSALSSFGVHMAQAGQSSDEEWVNADLLVGEDGSPVAIRFVRPAPQGSQN